MQRLSALASVDASARLEFLHRLFQLAATIATATLTPAHCSAWLGVAGIGKEPYIRETKLESDQLG